MINRVLFFNLGGFNPALCNFEDDELCRIARDFGFSCKVVGGTWVHHEEHASFKQNGVDIESSIRASEKIYNKRWSKVRGIFITLNERNTLPDLVKQIRPFTDEICILDSGSKDGTVEWALDNGLKVAHRDFDRFDNQRNAALERFSVGADWVLMFDPDERLDEDTLANFWELTRQDDIDIYLAPLWAKDAQGSEVEWVAKPFLFRNMEGIRWVFPAHEKLVGSHRQAIIRNARLVHLLGAHADNRRNEMSEFYSQLDCEGRSGGEFPILDYNHRDDDRIRKVFLGQLVSVVVSTYNRPDLLQRAVESILAQDYLAKEVIVVGDNCPEASLERVPALADARVRFYNLPQNHGAGGAVPRNYAIRMSAGGWIGYLDDDNVLKSNHLSSILLAVWESNALFGLSSLSVDGKPIICSTPKLGSVDTSCLVHRKELVSSFDWWKNRVDGGYSHDWTFVEPWVSAGVTWITTKQATVIYNKETCGQREFLERKLAEMGT